MYGRGSYIEWIILFIILLFVIYFFYDDIIKYINRCNENVRKDSPPKPNGGSKGSKGETACKEFLESFYGEPFPKVRPPFLANPETGRNLELDGYNERLRIAFEYNGIQHYEFPNGTKMTKEEFEAQKRRDIFKINKCMELGIYLIVIPYTIKLQDIPDYLLRRLPNLV